MVRTEVVAAGVAEVDAAFDDRDRPEGLPHVLGGPIVRGVVDEHDLDFSRERLPQDRGQATVEVTKAPKADDDDGYARPFRHSPVASSPTASHAADPNARGSSRCQQTLHG